MSLQSHRLSKGWTEPARKCHLGLAEAQYQGFHISTIPKSRYMHFLSWFLLNQTPAVGLWRQSLPFRPRRWPSSVPLSWKTLTFSSPSGPLASGMSFILEVALSASGLSLSFEATRLPLAWTYLWRSPHQLSVGGHLIRLLLELSLEICSVCLFHEQVIKGCLVGLWHDLGVGGCPVSFWHELSQGGHLITLGLTGSYLP